MQSHSEGLNELAAALVVAQAAFPNIDMDGTGQVGQNRNYKYATLAHIIKTVTPVLTANGIAVVQTCEPASPGALRVTTTLLHKSGQFLEGTLEMPGGSTPQQAGSAMTYARRYSLAAILGVAADEDDDGAQASQPRRQQPARARTEPEPAQQRAIQDGPAVPHKYATPKDCSDVARRWFMANIKDEHGVTPEQAKVLLGIKSFTDDMGDHTFEQILYFIGVAKSKAAQLAGTRN